MTHVTVSPDGELVAFYLYDNEEPAVDLVVCDKTGLGVWEGEVWDYALSHKDSLQFSPDGKLLLSLIRHHVVIYDARNGTNVFERNINASHCQFAPNGAFFAAISMVAPRLMLFDTGNTEPALWNTQGIPVRAVALHNADNVVSFAVSSSLIAHGGRDGIVRVENIFTGALVHEKTVAKPEPLTESLAPEFKAELTRLGLPHPNDIPIDNICFAPNDKFFAVSVDSEVRIWDVMSGELCYMFNSGDNRMDYDELHSLQYSHDSQLLLTAGQCLVARITDVSFVKTTRCRLREELAVALELYRKNTQKLMSITVVDPDCIVFCRIISRLSHHLVLDVFHFI